MTSKQSFTKGELSFTKDLPEHVEIECPVCFLVMLEDPYLTSCGHHFCGPCIKQIKGTNGACPVCNRRSYQIFPDKNILRIVRGLQVYCRNKKSGCKWKGELKDLTGHIDEGKRDGECKYEVVDCLYRKPPQPQDLLRRPPIISPLDSSSPPVPPRSKSSYPPLSQSAPKVPPKTTCNTRDRRQVLDRHESHECPCRPYSCQYCGHKGTFGSITGHHYDECQRYPVPCSNYCTGAMFERCFLQYHLENDCPRRPVECEYKWAGCHETPPCRDLEQHNIDSMASHLTLLHIYCSKIHKEKDELARENEALKERINQSGKKNKKKF